MNRLLTIHLPKGQALSFTADSLTSGTYVRLPVPGGAQNSPTAFSASTSYTIGPFNNPRDYKFDYVGTELSLSYANSNAVAGEDYENTTLSDPANTGTAATNVTAAEYGEDYKHTTVLTVSSAVLPAITGGAAESEGVLLYTLPAGACIVEQAYMSLAIQQQDGNIDADTPEVGLGTTIGSGANATLGAVDAAAENIITAQTAADCDGAATVKTIGNQVLSIETGDDHTVYFNVADTWAASGDTGALVSGTVVLHWKFMA